MTYKILQGDAIEVMKTLDAGTVDMCVTSPHTCVFSTACMVNWEAGLFKR